MSTKRLPTEERREQLADAALSILNADGARAVTVKNIAKKVGISDGAVFRHFPDTKTLFSAAVARFDSRLPALPSEELAPQDRLGAFFVGRVQAVQAEPEILGLAMSDRLTDLVTGEDARRLKHRMQESSSFVVRALTEAQANGEIDASLDPKTLTWMLTGALRGTARSGAPPEPAWHDVRAVLFGAGVETKTRGKSLRRPPTKDE